MAKHKRIKDITNSIFKKLSRMEQVKPTLGTDPEFFIAEKDSGKIMPADKFFPDKNNPLLVTPGEYSKISLFFDGIQAEANVPSSVCRESLASFVRRALKSAKNIIGANYTIVTRPSVRVQKNIIKEAKPEARIFGCEPDFNAYTGGTNTKEIDASNHPFRYAGGHIHIGISSPYLKEGCTEYNLAKSEQGHIKAIKMFDYLSGPIMVLMERGADAKRRRSLYGAAGCFRPTPYGVEYRTPSCWWVKSPISMSLIFGLVRLAWSLLVREHDEEFKKAVGFSEEEVRAIVNESDVVTAKKFWKSMRPYIAVTGKNCYNPLHIGSLAYDKLIASGSPDFVLDESSWRDRAANGKNIVDGPTVTHTLAAFEYMVKHGSDIFITDDLDKEWRINDNSYSATNGMINAMYHKLHPIKESVNHITVPQEIISDFFKFQSDFIKSVV